MNRNFALVRRVGGRWTPRQLAKEWAFLFDLRKRGERIFGASLLPGVFPRSPRPSTLEMRRDSLFSCTISHSGKSPSPGREQKNKIWGEEI